ncbi:GNAT family N-acetyltransferase [Clostridium ihumii]|uniref:GNAT family N-acetyltransferase n=1 Tax=Clostridium ihumii TaxID=1470356 RepID=UPI003D343D37
MMNINIETDNLIVRPFSSVDVEDAAYYSQQPKVSYWMADMVMHDEKEALDWIEWINKKFDISEPFIMLAIEHKCDHKCIGFVGVHAQAMVDNEVEISYAVSDNYQGKGYGTEAAKTLIKWIFKNTELKELVAIVKPDNIPSNTVIKKLGFQAFGNKVAKYCGEMCKFNYYKLYKKLS